MNKKSINTHAISNELAGGASLFFSKPGIPSPVSETPTVTEPDPQANKDTNHDVTTSSSDEVNFRKWKDIIENTETHNSSLRLSNEENYAAEDLVNELKRNLKIKSSLNEIVRLGLLYIIRDFNQNRESSLIYKVKKS
jgi:hypothetical protein